MYEKRGVFVGVNKCALFSQKRNLLEKRICHIISFAIVIIITIIIIINVIIIKTW